MKNTDIHIIRDEDPTFFSIDPDPTLNRNEDKIYSFFRELGIKFDIINHHFMLEFV